MSNCAKCKLKKSDGFVGCEGSCGKWFHHTCIGLNLTDFSVLEKCKNLLYVCDPCRIKCEVVDKTKVDQYTSNLTLVNEKILEMSEHFEKILDTKIKELSSSIKLQTEHYFKNEVLPIIRECNEVIVPKIHELHPKLDLLATQETHAPKNISYASAVQNKPAFVVQPKDKTQRVHVTKADMLKNIDPVESNITFSSLKKVSNGGLVINCINSDECEKFKALANTKLCGNYEVKEVMPLNPRIKVVGISEQASGDAILKYIKSQNKDIFADNSICEFLNLKPLKKNKHMYQATLQIDKVSYNKVMAQGKLFVGYDYCTVFDAIELRRCYKCNGFHHNAAKCSSNVTYCPRCAQNHKLEDCQSNIENCINCINLNKKKADSNVNVNHTVWNSNCTAYKQELDKLRSSILNPQ